MRIETLESELEMEMDVLIPILMMMMMKMGYRFSSRTRVELKPMRILSFVLQCNFCVTQTTHKLKMNLNQCHTLIYRERETTNNARVENIK